MDQQLAVRRQLLTPGLTTETTTYTQVNNSYKQEREGNYQNDRLRFTNPCFFPDKNLNVCFDPHPMISSLNF